MKHTAIFSLILLQLLVACETKLKNFESAAKCAECHDQIHNEWTTAAHATAGTNQIYLKLREKAQAAVNSEFGQKCDKCHLPLQTVANEIAAEGITCDLCHRASNVQAGVGIDGYVFGEKGVRYGPWMYSEPLWHKSQFSGLHTESSICFPCHEIAQNQHQLELCITGTEYQKGFHYSKGVTCQECHMPTQRKPVVKNGEEKRIRNHAIYTAKEKALDLATNAYIVNDTIHVDVAVSNVGAGHHVPTGIPARLAYLKLSAFDSSGNLLWVNWKDNPMEDQQSVFMRRLGKKGSDGFVPPWEADTLLFDQRIAPGETRDIAYQLIGVKADKIQADIYYASFVPEIYQLVAMEPEEPILIGSATSNVNLKQEKIIIKTEPTIPVSSDSQSSKNGKITHVNGADEFSKVVLKSSKTVVVDFWANWCKPCKMLNPIIEKLSNEISGVKFVKIDVDKNRPLSQQYGIRGIPAMVIFKNGKEVDRITGLLSEDQLRNRFNEHK